jgi:GTPase SAR1 family protein
MLPSPTSNASVEQHLLAKFCILAIGFHKIDMLYYCAAFVTVIVYNISDPKSFKHVVRWLGIIDCFAHKDVNRMIVGNKCNLYKNQCVKTEAAKELADLLGIPFAETSAKSNANVDELLLSFAWKIMNHLEREEPKEEVPVRPAPSKHQGFFTFSKKYIDNLTICHSKYQTKQQMPNKHTSSCSKCRT